MKNMNNLIKEPPSTRARQTIELISFLTHEFKTPLTSIIASAGLLAEELALPPDDPKTKLVTNILTSAYNLETRASELLNLAKLEAQGFHLEMEPADVNAVIYNAIDQLSSIISSRHQSLTINLAPDVPHAMADSLRLEQILLNLLSNASKFSPENSSISLSANRHDNYLVIEMKDSSTPIPLEECNKIFQPYYQFKPDKENTSGIGLGLALCKHLVELHGGQIWVEGNQDKGNTFSFTLPLETTQQTSEKLIGCPAA